MAIIASMNTFQSCTNRNSGDVWDDTKSAGRHMKRGVRALGGKNSDSRQVRSRSDFECIDDGEEYTDNNGFQFQDCEYQDNNITPVDMYSNNTIDSNNYSASDFVPLQDSCNDIAMADMVAPQPRETPGEIGSSIPGIQAFRDPSTIPQLAGIFRNIYFEYDSSLVKGQQNLQIIHNIADLMRRNPNLYVFVEGHTDERGPQAYNYALGSRRSNAVRNLLISEGVSPDRLFTISYGKDRPVVLERHEEGWSKNRRVEFKVYER